jgi:hypothetical protein
LPQLSGKPIFKAASCTMGSRPEGRLGDISEIPMTVVITYFEAFGLPKSLKFFRDFSYVHIWQHPLLASFY